jgi:hypothetical protein
VRRWIREVRGLPTDPASPAPPFYIQIAIVHAQALEEFARKDVAIKAMDEVIAQLAVADARRSKSAASIARSTGSAIAD